MKNTEELKRWTKSFFVTALMFAVFTAYVYIRRGSFSLSTLNKVLGSIAIFLAGFTLLIAPLKANFLWIMQFMTIRRHLGLIAFGAAILHMVISIFFIPRFNLDWYKDQWIAILFGVLGIILWLYLTYLSRNTQIIRMGAQLWKKHLSLGARIALWLLLLHVVILKYNDWITYFKGQTQASSFLKNPAYPPESFFVFLFLAAILLYRLQYDWAQKQKLST